MTSFATGTNRVRSKRASGYLELVHQVLQLRVRLERLDEEVERTGYVAHVHLEARVDGRKKRRRNRHTARIVGR